MQENRISPVATIKSGQSVSDIIQLDRASLVGFVAPSVWTAAQLTIEASVDGLTWLSTLYDLSGNVAGQYASFVSGAGYALDPVAWLGYRFFRIRSGTAGSPVAQGADTTIALLARSLA